MTEWATLLILETLEPLILEHICKRLFLNLGIHENWHRFERTHRHKSKYILHYYLFMFCLSIQFKLSFIVAFVSAQKYQPNYAKCFPKIILLSSYILNLGLYVGPNCNYCSAQVLVWSQIANVQKGLWWLLIATLNFF